MSKITQANELFKAGKYQEAESLYRKLYEETGLDLYKFGIEYAIRKQSGEFSEDITYKPSTNSQKESINESKRAFVIKENHKKSNRILFITAGLKGPTPGGGIATCFHSMIKTMGLLSNLETDVIYIAHPYYSKGNYETWKEFYKKECNANLISINVNDKHYGSKEMKRSYAILDFLLENSHNYDSVVFHDFMGLAYYPLLVKRMGLGLQDLKIVISAHGNHKLSNFFGKRKVDSWHTKAILFMERMSLKFADEITSPSYFYKDWLKNNLEADENKIKVLPNIIYSSNSSEILDVKFKDESKKLIAFYGRIERLKGIDILIEAIKKFNKKDIKQNILIAGVSTKIDGIDAKDYILKGLENSGCEIQFKFNCQPIEVFNYINKNNGICILPTLGENAPCIVVECILHGVRFIASDIPGIKEMVNPKYHHMYLFKTGSVDELIEKFNLEINAPTENVLSYNMKQNEKDWVSFLSNSSNQLVNLNKKVHTDTTPLVSVIIPTSDRPELLEQAIISINEQTYGNFEIIVVDDNSVDFELNRKLAEKYNCSYIYLSEKAYKGKACNIGASYAQGDYICFFDDDDIANELMLQRYIQAYKNLDLDIISGFCDVFEHSKVNELPRTEYASLALGGGLEVNLSINMFGKGSFIVKKSIFDKIGGYEVDDSAVPTVDYRFYLKAALEGAKISIVPFPQYYYRKNSPKSLFYIAGNDRTQKFLAKTSVEKIFEQKFGRDLAMGISSMIWDVALPSFE